VKGGLSDSDLTEKYGLTVKQLDGVFRRLEERGLLTRGESDRPRLPPETPVQAPVTCPDSATVRAGESEPCTEGAAVDPAPRSHPLNAIAKALVVALILVGMWWCGSQDRKARRAIIERVSPVLTEVTRSRAAHQPSWLALLAQFDRKVSYDGAPQTMKEDLEAVRSYLGALTTLQDAVERMDRNVRDFGIGAVNVSVSVPRRGPRITSQWSLNPYDPKEAMEAIKVDLGALCRKLLRDMRDLE